MRSTLKIFNHPRLRFFDYASGILTSTQLSAYSAKPYYFKNARSALYAVLSRFLPEQSCKNVLVPSYYCGEELEAIKNAGGNLVFYQVNKDCSIDLSDLKSKINSEVIAIHVIHYNGKIQALDDIRKIADEYNLLIIEDCAHVIDWTVTSGSAGSVGDIAIFSPRKYFPVRNGGILIVNNEHIKKKNLAHGSEDISIYSDIKYLIREILDNNSPRELAKANHAIERSDKQNPDGKIYPQKYESENYNKNISWLSRFYLGRCNYAEIRRKRQENYLYLWDAFAEIENLKNVGVKLSAEECPLHFLVEVSDPWKLAEKMLVDSVSTTVFWSHFHENYPYDEFPDSTYLKKHVLALPIHQDLTLKDMEYVAATTIENSRALEHI